MSETIRVSVDADLEPLIPGFLENRQKDIATLKSALAAKDMDAIQSVGHSLKGVGGGYGFPRITDIGAGLEAAARDRDTGMIAERVNELEQYLQHVEVVYE